MNDIFNLYKPYNDQDCILIKKYKKKIYSGQYNDKKYKFICKGGSGYIFNLIIQKNNYKLKTSLKFVESNHNEIKYKNFLNSKFKNWNELIILRHCTKYVIDGLTQNLLINYSFKVCPKIKYILLYNELADCDFEKWICEERNELEWKSFLFQFWCTLYLLQKKLKLVHNDLRLPNILFIKIKSGGYWKYEIDDDEYFVPNMGYVFIIWDFGSAQSLNFSNARNKEYVKNKLEANIDLMYIHDLYKRLRVLLLENLFDIDQLEKFFITTEEKNIYKIEYNKNKQRFTDDRFKKKFKLALIYYLIEKNRFDDLLKSYRQVKSLVKMPPQSIDLLLKELNDKHNYSYCEREAFYKQDYDKLRKLTSPKVLIDTYLSEFKIKKPYINKFKF